MLPQATAIVERQYCNDDAVIWQQEDLFRFKYYTILYGPKQGSEPLIKVDKLKLVEDIMTLLLVFLHVYESKE